MGTVVRTMAPYTTFITASSFRINKAISFRSVFVAGRKMESGISK